LFIDAVMETAELRNPASIESAAAEGGASAIAVQTTKFICRASRFSAESAALVAIEGEPLRGVSLSCRRPVQFHLAFGKSIRRVKCSGKSRFQGLQPSGGGQGNTRSNTAEQAMPRLSHKALPNPSLKPSPNSKTPGRRRSAGVHFLQRRPGVFLSVPA
jgi:hypothetical protein